MLLNKGFNDKSTQTKSTTFHSRKEGMSPTQELQLYGNLHKKEKERKKPFIKFFNLNLEIII